MSQVSLRDNEKNQQCLVTKSGSKPEKYETTMTPAPFWHTTGFFKWTLSF